MSVATFARPAAAVGALGLAGASMFGATAAFAAVPDETCELPDAYVVSAGVCELLLTEDGTFTFSSELGKVSAVLVGGGGGGATTWYGEPSAAAAGGGGGGQVVYVDDVALDTEITVTIGGGSSSVGGDTIFGDVTAGGGKSAYYGGGGNSETPTGAVTSGASFSAGTLFDDLDAPYYLAGGAGSGGSATNATSGAGFLLSEIPGVDPDLFPAAADFGVSYGSGGVAAVLDAGAVTEVSDAEAAGVVDEPVSEPNSGAGGNAYLSYDTDITGGGVGGFVDASGGMVGQDGAVIVRFASEIAPEETLPDTGVDAAGLLLGAGAAAVGGAALLATARRRRASH